MGSARQVRGARRLHPWIVDLFVGVGTLWSALLGVGGLLCILTDDPGATILSAVLVTGTIGAQGVRSPGSPRLNIFQMCLVVVPFGIGVSFSTIPLAGWVAPIIPLYLFSMVSITLQLHDDYVKLIVARIENRQRALHCPLTGLPNRAFFGEGLAEALETAEAGFGAVTVMYLDLDGFKAVNDRFGHRAGDDVLRQVADRLRGWKHLRATVARLGGDEFAVLIRADLDDLEASVRRLIETLSLPYDIGADGSASIGVSVGLATSETGADAADLLMRADQALYAAKRAGKGTFRWHGGAEETAHGQPSTIDLNGMLRRMRGVQERAISPAHT